MTYRDWSVERSNSGKPETMALGGEGRKGRRGEGEAGERTRAVHPRCRAGRDESTKTARSQDTILTWVTRRMQVKCKIIRETYTCGYALRQRAVRKEEFLQLYHSDLWRRGRLFYEKQSALDLLRYVFEKLLNIYNFIIYKLY